MSVVSGRMQGAERAVGRARPPLFRALGDRDVPREVAVQGDTFRVVQTFKHDSWAATALYEDIGGRRIVCKFNRQQPILGLPMRWLGRRLARREAHALRVLSEESLVPNGCGPVQVDGRRQHHAVAHDFVPGRPLRRNDRFDAEFFDDLTRLLAFVHARRIAYVDLHKRENILLGEDGRPHLIDFQISLRLPRVWPLSRVLRLLQESDLYHLAKHEAKLRGEVSAPGLSERTARPWWIRLHRLVAVPFRTNRRRLLVLLGIRTGTGKAHTEESPEYGVNEWTLGRK